MGWIFSSRQAVLRIYKNINTDKGIEIEYEFNIGKIVMTRSEVLKRFTPKKKKKTWKLPEIYQVETWDESDISYSWTWSKMGQIEVQNKDSPWNRL